MSEITFAKLEPDARARKQNGRFGRPANEPRIAIWKFIAGQKVWRYVCKHIVKLCESSSRVACFYCFASTMRSVRLASVSSASIICQTDVHRARSLRKKLHSLGIPSLFRRERDPNLPHRLLRSSRSRLVFAVSTRLSIHQNAQEATREAGALLASLRKRERRPMIFLSGPSLHARVSELAENVPC